MPEVWLVIDELLSTEIYLGFLTERFVSSAFELRLFLPKWNFILGLELSSKPRSLMTRLLLVPPSYPVICNEDLGLISKSFSSWLLCVLYLFKWLFAFLNSSPHSISCNSRCSLAVGNLMALICCLFCLPDNSFVITLNCYDKPLTSA